MSAFYNEIDPYCAQWLRNLIDAGHIAPGIVDERSIEDITPNELREYTQCHFFAGVGVWSYALRLAGWPDDRPVWTGSCPCQPFSAAGKRAGFADQRHLWPAWFHLIRECRPSVVFGEQVASRDGLDWLDLVQADMEGANYASGSIDFCAAGVGAPHIRQRLWFVGEGVDHAAGSRHLGSIEGAEGQARNETRMRLFGAGIGSCGLADTYGRERDGIAIVRGDERNGPDAGWAEGGGCIVARRDIGGMADSSDHGPQGRVRGRPSPQGEAIDGSAGCNGATRGHWAGADWVYCRDEKFRPIEPGTFPLAYGIANRVGRLRAYGNCIAAPAAEAFIRAYLESRMTEEEAA